VGLKIPEKDEPKIVLQDLVVLVQAHPTLFALGLCGVAYLFQLLKFFTPIKTKEREILDALVNESLDEFRSKVFYKISPDTPSDHVRVTLFKHHDMYFFFYPFRGYLTPWGLPRNPFSGWLVVTHRSGHLTKWFTTVFLAPDDADNAEGMAGRAFRSNGTIFIGMDTKDPLPDLRDVKYISWWKRRRVKFNSEKMHAKSIMDVQHEKWIKQFEDYAKRTRSTTTFVWDRIKRRRPNPTLMIAMRIQSSQNKPFGVIVLDSCCETEFLPVNSQKFRNAFGILDQKMRSLGAID